MIENIQKINRPAFKENAGWDPLIGKLEALKKELCASANMFDAYNEIADEGQRLRGKYGNEYAESIRAFHLLSGSTPVKGALFVDFDFPKEDSVLSFIEKLHNKYCLHGA